MAVDFAGHGSKLGCAVAVSVDEVEAWYNPLEKLHVFDGAFGPVELA
jgi:hypothetical protein